MVFYLPKHFPDSSYPREEFLESSCLDIWGAPWWGSHPATGNCARGLWWPESSSYAFVVCTLQVYLQGQHAVQTWLDVPMHKITATRWQKYYTVSSRNEGTNRQRFLTYRLQIGRWLLVILAERLQVNTKRHARFMQEDDNSLDLLFTSKLLIAS